MIQTIIVSGMLPTIVGTTVQIIRFLIRLHEDMVILDNDVKVLIQSIKSLENVTKTNSHA